MFAAPSDSLPFLLCGPDLTCIHALHSCLHTYTVYFSPGRIKKLIAMRLGIAELHAHRDKPQAGPEGRINAPESV